MTVVVGQRAEVAFPCEHDGWKGVIVRVAPDYSLMRTDKPDRFTGKQVLLKYPPHAFIPERKKES